jgi:predicted NUDIX family NTP pyrophosphohydrolase
MPGHRLLQLGDNASPLLYKTSMPNRTRAAGKVRSVSAKEVSVLAWIQDAYGNVLLIQQTAGKQLWSLPGGKVHSAEALKQALRRELKEEIGLTVVFQTKLRKGRLKLGEKEIKSAAFVSKLPLKATPSVRYFWKRQFPSVSGRGNILDL